MASLNLSSSHFLIPHIYTTYTALPNLIRTLPSLPFCRSEFPVRGKNKNKINPRNAHFDQMTTPHPKKSRRIQPSSPPCPKEIHIRPSTRSLPGLDERVRPGEVNPGPAPAPALLLDGRNRRFHVETGSSFSGQKGPHFQSGGWMLVCCLFQS